MAPVKVCVMHTSHTPSGMHIIPQRSRCRKAIDEHKNTRTHCTGVVSHALGARSSQPASDTHDVAAVSRLCCLLTLLPSLPPPLSSTTPP